MAFIKSENICFKYENQIDYILENLNFEITNNDKIGLIGKNGIGKTTLLKLIMQMIKPLSGNMNIKKGLFIGYLPQEISYDINLTLEEFLLSFDKELITIKRKTEAENNPEICENIEEFEDKGGYNFLAEISKNLYKFEFTDEDLQRNINSFSGGEKNKASLLRLIIQNPDLLILDEPTNHLDKNSLIWLEDFLENINLSYLVISHDRMFLDKTVNKIWELYNNGIVLYSGNYSFYKATKENEYNRRVKEYEKCQKKISQLKNVYIQRKNWAMNFQTQTGSNGYAPVYEDVTNAARKAMKRAKAVENRINREISKEEAKKPFVEKKYRINFADTNLRNKFILKVENLTKSFDHKTIMKDLSFDIKLHDRIAITGKNGIGKSTLFRILINSLEPDAGIFKWSPQVKIGYFAQDFENLDFSKNILENILCTNNHFQDITDKEKQNEARNILGKFDIRGEKVFEKISTLSIGERTKVALSKILFSNPDILLLDEPTNHLEISSREIFEEALLNYQGSILFISHDRHFIKKIATREIDLNTNDIIKR